MLQSYPKVAIVGRVNVGKSTLFNRLVGGRQAITQEEPGVTRDRLYGDVLWRGRKITFIDTGGIQNRSVETIARGVYRQTSFAVDEADILVFVVDLKEGITSEDRDVAQLLKTSGKAVILTANKAESTKESSHYYDMFELGFGEPIQISAIHGDGTGDLLDHVIELLNVMGNAVVEEEEISEEIKVAIVGRPNVGKSSLINAILGEDRVLVNELPGTTRDAIDTTFVYDGTSYRFIDTAGMRRKARVHDSVEFYSTVRAKDAIKKAHVAVLIIEWGGVVQQDKIVASEIQDAGRASIIVVNKTDLLPKNKKGKVNAVSLNEVLKEVSSKVEFMKYAPVCFTSALKNEGIEDLLKTIKNVFIEYNKRIETPLLNKWVREFVVNCPPNPHNKGVLKILYVTQVKTAPPSFVLFVNDPDFVSPTYRRYLVNRLRDVFEFIGSPVHLIFKKRAKVELPA